MEKMFCIKCKKGLLKFSKKEKAYICNKCKDSQYKFGEIKYLDENGIEMVVLMDGSP